MSIEVKYMVRCMKLVSVGLLSFCESGCMDATPLPPIKFTQGPTVTMDPNGLTPLAGVIEFETDVPVHVTLTASNGSDIWIADFPELDKQHSIPVLGLKPNSGYTLQLSVRDARGLRVSSAPQLRVVTDPLPVDFPTVEVLISNPDRMEPGFTVLDVTRRGREDTRDNWTIIVDGQGQVVWYSTSGGQATRQIDNGNLVYLSEDSMVELDFIGNSSSVAFQDPGRGLHHDLFATVDGTLLSLSRQVSTAQNYPTTLTDPNAPTETADIADDLVVEFSQDGTLLNTWSTAELLDPTRLGYDSFRHLPSFGLDWGHANAVLHDSRDDSIIVSFRHQEAVVKFSRATGELIWILGPHQNWAPEFQPFLLKPVGTPFEWQYHQHAPMITPAGTLLLFDNGNYRAMPFDGTTPLANADSYSRAVEFSIDKVSMEVRQVWDYGRDDGERIFAAVVGDVDWLDTTGNVLVHFGRTSFTDGIYNSDLGRGAASIRIIEVTHDSPAEKVFDLAIYNPEPTAALRAYRSERIPSLYPASVVVR